MKKLMLLCLLALAPFVQAQQWTQLQTTVSCGPFRDIVRVLTQARYNEMPLWVGQSGRDATSFTLFLNADSGGWTLLQYYGETACILGMGDASNITNLAPFSQKY
jgi:hypothetical protein